MTHHASFPPNSSHRRQLLGAAAAATVLGTSAGAARAQAAWPAGKPIRIVLPSGAGGGSDNRLIELYCGHIVYLSY